MAQFIRYVVVGGFNTVLGYGVFAILNWYFTGLGRYSYMYAAALGSLITISVAFLGYKWFVFKTRGNYLVEWIRCLGVYSSSVFLSLAGLPILVTLIRPHLHRPELASYIAAAAMMVIIVVFGFVGHKNISFRQKMVEGEVEPRSKTPAP